MSKVVQNVKKREHIGTGLTQINERPQKQKSVTRLAPSSNKLASFAERNQAHLAKIKEKRFEENLLKELEHQRVAEAKQRLRSFVVNTEMNDQAEQTRLLKYFAHRYVTFIKLLNECVRARKFKPKGGQV